MTLFPDFEENPKKRSETTPFEADVERFTERVKLFTVGNPKILKGVKKGYMSIVLMLSPAYLSGREVCAFRTDGCTRACLNTAGQGGIVKGGAKQTEEVIRKSNVVQQARVLRTDMLYEKTPGKTSTPVVTEAFGSLMIHDIKQLVDFCDKYNITPSVRLNGTSDLLWEKMPVHAKRNIMAWYPKVKFYDYTKYPLASRMEHPKNYFLNYSLNEDPESPRRAHQYLIAGMNAVAVFSTRRGRPLPRTWKISGQTFKVIDGDLHDLRFIDPSPAIVGLRAKGFAQGDTTGFVIRLPQDNPKQEDFNWEGGELFPDFS